MAQDSDKESEEDKEVELAETKAYPHSADEKRASPNNRRRKRTDQRINAAQSNESLIEESDTDHL